MNFLSVKIPNNISKQDWLNWKWQMRHCLKTKIDYKKYFHLTTEEEQSFNHSNFAVQTTPYYAQVACSSPIHPLRKVIIPCIKEQQIGRQAMLDPLGEKDHSPVQHIIHRYPDRVVFLVTDLCPIYCRYCTRKRFTAVNKKMISADEYQKALAYIQSRSGIREVILSGGDPLTLSDGSLEKILKDLRLIEHIEIIRIGSRMPAVCPMRISKTFIEMIKKYQPVFIMSHFNHPAEITAESADMLNQLADNGIAVFNQMVLINGVNNHPAIVQALCRRLLFLRVRPYYMFQCDPSLGTDHLRTSVANSRWIQKQLWGVLSGLATPRLAMDIPGGGGKVEIVPTSSLLLDKHTIIATGWDGIKGTYQEPDKESIQEPSDLHLYLEEWNILRQQSYGCLIE